MRIQLPDVLVITCSETERFEFSRCFVVCCTQINPHLEFPMKDVAEILSQSLTDIYN